MENTISIIPFFEFPISEVDLKPIRASGPGGQHVNKVETGVELRYDVNKSSLPQDIKEKVLLSPDGRLTKDGVLIIQAINWRSQDKNKQESIKRLVHFLKPFFTPPKVRKPSRVPKGVIAARKKEKAMRTEIKKTRQKPEIPD